MKTPKTFVPEKNLEKKTKQLLEGIGEKPALDDYDSSIDSEAEKLFPNFIKYLKEEYGGLIIEKKYNSIKSEWTVYLPKKGGGKVHIGNIQSYKEGIGPTLETGYEAEVISRTSYRSLKCRMRYSGYDSLGSPVSSEDVYRYDSNKYIPFP